MHEQTGYSSLQSESPEHSTVTSTEESSVAPQKSPASADVRSRPTKQIQDPPRNAADEIHCNHPDCKQKIPTRRLY